MARVISIVNQKGGTGKTTTAINLAAALAEKGYFVLLVDLDPQGNAGSGLGVKVHEKIGGVYEALLAAKPVSKMLYRTPVETLHLVPAHENLSGANIELVNLPEREYKLKKALLEVRGNYDFIIIDAPPTLGLLTLNTLIASDEVIIPVQCEYYALEGLAQLLQTVNLVQKNLHPGLKILGALLTMYHRRIRLSEDVVKEVRENFPHSVFKTVIPRSVRLAEAPSFGKSVLHLASWSNGARAYRKLAEEVLGG